MTIAKTPTVAIARVLRGLGLKQGKDFRVKGKYEGRGDNRFRVSTYVAVLSDDADWIIADNADQIEELVHATSDFTFYVSIYYTAGGRLWTWIENAGIRTRDTAPVATADKGQPELDAASRRVAHELGHRIVGGAPVIKAKLGAARPAFEQPKAPAAPDLDAHPYEGLAQKPFGSLTWACEEAGQTWFFQNTRNSPRYTLRVYRGRARLVGWYLSGPGIGQPGSDRYMGATVTIAATAAQDVILEHAWITGRMEEAATQWPKGTRVSGLNSHGVARTGTVNGVDVGMVTEPGHDNYGRTFVGVNWDAPERPELGYTVRNRPFVDTLTRI